AKQVKVLATSPTGAVAINVSLEGREHRERAKTAKTLRGRSRGSRQGDNADMMHALDRRLARIERLLSK
ncbi:unnamed protein product, partial [Prorocentrum cordatum]